MDSTLEKLLSIKEVADLLAVSRDSVSRLIRRGDLKAVEFPRMGGRGKNIKRQVYRGEVNRFVEACMKKAA
jgi:excisionase family DNA binding protein